MENCEIYTITVCPNLTDLGNMISSWFLFDIFIEFHNWACFDFYI